MPQQYKNSFNKSIFLSFVFVIALFLQADSRVINQKLTGTQMRKQQGWVFLDRMVIGPGELRISFDLKLETNKRYSNDQFQNELRLIEDGAWNLMNPPSCQQFNDKLSNLLNFLSVPASFNKETSLKGHNQQIFHIYKETTYHIVATDCKKTLINEHFNKKALLTIQVDIVSGDWAHSEDQKIYIWLLPLLGFLTIISYRYLNTVSKEEHRDTDYPRILLKIAIGANIASLLLSLFHHLLYLLFFGYYFYFLEFIEAFIDPISDVFLMILLVLFAYGWYTKPGALIDPQLYYAIAGMMGFSFVITNLLTKINDFSHDKYHFHDSIPSLVLISFRFVVLIIFLIGIGVTMNFIWSKKTKQNLNFNSFQKLLLGIGIPSILYMPLIVLISEGVGVGWRETFVFMGLRMVRSLCLIGVAWMLTNKKSVYRKVNKVDKTFFEEIKGL